MIIKIRRANGSSYIFEAENGSGGFVFKVHKNQIGDIVYEEKIKEINQIWKKAQELEKISKEEFLKLMEVKNG